MRALLLAGVAAVGWMSAAHAAPILDGSGFGAPSATVLYDPAAPTSNFGTPRPTTSGASYNVSSRADTTYAYVLLQQTGPCVSAGTFANLYFVTGTSAFSGSDVAFEVKNSDVFSSASAVSRTSTAGTGITFASLNGGTGIEFAIPFSYFENDPQGIGFDKVTASDPNIVLRLSQTFGYSVAGGPAYGVDRLGLFVDPFATAVPEPASLALLAAGMVGAGVMRRRRAA